MKYLILIHRNEETIRDMPEEERSKLFASYRAYGVEVTRSGKHEAGAKLQPPETATCVRVRDGRRLVTDGPFAETAEQLAGFMLLECKDLDEALDWAARHPDAHNGTVEVRPIEPWQPLDLKG